MHALDHLRRGWLPPLGGLLALLAFQVAGPLHYVVVEHAVCAEHGQAVHAEHGMAAHADGHDTGADDAHPELALAAETFSAAGESDHGAHEHCPLAGRERDQLALTHATSADAALERAVALTHPPQQSVRAACPLDGAPKTSPPGQG